MTTKTVSMRVSPDRPAELLATFELVGDDVHAHYHDSSFEEEMQFGVFVRGKTLKPSDGRTFFDGIERAFANSSRMIVRLIAQSA